MELSDSPAVARYTSRLDSRSMASCTSSLQAYLSGRFGGIIGALLLSGLGGQAYLPQTGPSEWPYLHALRSMLSRQASEDHIFGWVYFRTLPDLTTVHRSHPSRGSYIRQCSMSMAHLFR
jgi:hypothetical protein